MMYSWWDGSAVGWGGMILGPLMMIASIVLTVLVIAWALRATGLARPPGGGEQLPLEILNARFARGEIDRSEFEERRKVLLGL